MAESDDTTEKTLRAKFWSSRKMICPCVPPVDDARESSSVPRQGVPYPSTMMHGETTSERCASEIEGTPKTRVTTSEPTTTGFFHSFIPARRL